MDWQDLVDLERLAGWMDGHGLGRGPIFDVEPLTGGTQNVLLRLRRADRAFVLRRPPRHSIADGSETMRREVRVLAALAGTDVPHPRLLGACSTDEVLGAAFYVMEPVDGFNAIVGLPPLHAGDAAIRRAMGFAMVDAALALGRVDPFAAGLGDRARLANFLQRQASRWRAQYDRYGEHDGWQADSLTGVDAIARWLDERCPTGFTPGIMHGDYHFGNVMFRPDGAELAAIVDWELAAVGDPLLDMGWLLATWPGPDDAEHSVIPRPSDGFPTGAELVEHYAARSTRDCSAMVWYKVLACYKLAILLEGTNARAKGGKADPAIGDRLHAQAEVLMRRALMTIDSGKI